MLSRCDASLLCLNFRHVNNILVDTKTAEVIHIDLGLAFEQGKRLKMPETIPFRLTRDIVDGMGVCRLFFTNDSWFGCGGGGGGRGNVVGGIGVHKFFLKNARVF